MEDFKLHGTLICAYFKRKIPLAVVQQGRRDRSQRLARGPVRTCYRNLMKSPWYKVMVKWRQKQLFGGKDIQTWQWIDRWREKDQE